MNQIHKNFQIKEKEATRRAIEILRRFSIAVKIVRIYEPNNHLFLEQIRNLISLILNVLNTENEALFTLRKGALFFNGMKVRFSFSNYNLFRFMSSEFHGKELGGLDFKPGVTEEEVKQLAVLYSKKREGTTSFEDFMEEVRESGIKHISLEKALPLDMKKKSEKDAAKVFFLGITHLKEMHEAFESGEKVQMNITRRLMQSMFNHLVENESFVYGLTNIKNYDEYTLNHSINVCLLSISLGKRLGLDKNELVDLGISAFFHDFGKTEIPTEILRKPGKLDEREREIIEKHPHLGAEKLIQLKKYSSLPLRALNVAMEHHVKEDLGGYPQYKKKKQVNLYSKIVKICDFFDALTTERPYRKKAFSRDDVLRMMMEKSGIEFDSILLKAFVNMIGAYPVGTLVLLHTNEIGVVFEINMEPAFVNRPKVKLITNKNGKKLDGDVVDLTEIDPGKNQYKRTIIKSLEPHKYDVQVSDYFLVQAQ